MAMAMAMPFLFSPNSTLPFFSSNTNPHLLFSSHSRRESSLPPISSASAQTTPAPINVEYFSREFSGHGVAFESLGDDCAVRMCVDNGSVATMMLPSGLVTSYKPQLWHGTTAEVLQTSVMESEDGEAVVITGGVSVGFSFFGSRSDLGGGSSSSYYWSPTSWALLDVKGSSEDCVQVELISVDPESTIEIKYVVTLGADLLGSEVTITNLKSTSVQVVGFVLTHLKASTPDATYAFGLQGSNYQRRPPLQSGFSIIPPGYLGRNNSKNTTSVNNSWWGGKVKDQEEEEESDHSLHMSEKLSRVYTCAPRQVTVLDRVSKNFTANMLSPGSEHEWYGKYAYVCMGPSALLKPITLVPHQVWCGGQSLHNPNL